MTPFIVSGYHLESFLLCVESSSWYLLLIYSQTSVEDNLHNLPLPVSRIIYQMPFQLSYSYDSIPLILF